MRLVFLVLVLLNLAFFAWARWIDVPARAPGAASGLPTLQLVGATAAPAPAPAPAPRAAAVEAASSPAVQPSSAGPPAAAAPAALAATGADPQAAARCRSVGPFDDATAASAIAERLRTAGWQPRAREVPGQVLDGYWVYLSGLTDGAAIRSTLARLAAAGIHDAAALQTPEQSDRISVGFFADQAHAVRRAEQVRALGFRPTLDVHQRATLTHWIDFDLKAGDPEPNPAAVLGEDAAAANAPQLVPCPAAGAGAAASAGGAAGAGAGAGG